MQALFSYIKYRIKFRMFCAYVFTSIRKNSGFCLKSQNRNYNNYWGTLVSHRKSVKMVDEHFKF